MSTEQQNIVIVGAGPTGLALATELQRLQVPHLLLDRLAAGANTSRAVVIHARTLEVLEPLGVAPKLIAAGMEVPAFVFRERDHVLATVHFSELDSAYKYLLSCPQDRTEAILLERLESLGGQVRRPWEVTAVEVNGEGAELQVQTPEGSRTLQARWLIGCDGGHSVVRQAAGVAFEGGNYAENFVLGDLDLQGPLSHDEGQLFLSSDGIMVVVPLPDEGRFRLIATVDEAPEKPGTEDFQRLLDERGLENSAMRVETLHWASRFRIQHRIAEHFRAGRVLLAGDAAHVHSPAGGQGMNTGIQDGVSLADVLANIQAGGDEAGLDAWAKRRHEIARSVVALTDRMTRLGIPQTAAGRAVRNTMVELIGHLPFAERMLAHKLSELDNR